MTRALGHNLRKLVAEYLEQHPEAEAEAVRRTSSQRGTRWIFNRRDGRFHGLAGYPGLKRRDRPCMSAAGGGCGCDGARGRRAHAHGARPVLGGAAQPAAAAGALLQRGAEAPVGLRGVDRGGAMGFLLSPLLSRAEPTPVALYVVTCAPPCALADGCVFLLKVGAFSPGFSAGVPRADSGDHPRAGLLCGLGVCGRAGTERGGGGAAGGGGGRGGGAGGGSVREQPTVTIHDSAGDGNRCEHATKQRSRSARTSAHNRRRTAQHHRAHSGAGPTALPVRPLMI